MKFIKRKSKLIAYYVFFYFFIAILLALICALFFNDDAFKLTVLAEIILIAIIFSFSKMHIAELNQEIEINESSIYCKNFVVNGKAANAKITYEKIESIELKRIPFRPFSRCLYIQILEGRPFVVNEDYINHCELWEIICENSKKANQSIVIDKNIVKYLEKNNIGKGSAC